MPDADARADLLGLFTTAFDLQGSEFHHYQPGWTLVGSGLAKKENLRRPTSSLVPSHLAHHQSHASTFSPTTNSLTLASGQILTYDYLVVCPGLKLNFGAVEGLEAALKAGTKESAVGSIYTYDGCDQVWDAIKDFNGQKAIFTQPKGIVKCAGAPQVRPLAASAIPPGACRAHTQLSLILRKSCGWPGVSS